MLFRDITAGYYKYRHKYVNLLQVKSFWKSKPGGPYRYRDTVKHKGNNDAVCR